MPADSDQTPLYRLVFEHGDFGVHNMSITMDANGQPLVTSPYDWETGCIVPAILSDPVMTVRAVDLVTDENAAPSIAGTSDDATPNDCAQYMTWSRQYFKVRTSFKHDLSQFMNGRLTAFLRAGSLRSSAQLRARNPGRERRKLPLSCIARLARRRSGGLFSVTWGLGLRGG